MTKRKQFWIIFSIAATTLFCILIIIGFLWKLRVTEQTKEELIKTLENEKGVVLEDDGYFLVIHKGRKGYEFKGFVSPSENGNYVWNEDPFWKTGGQLLYDYKVFDWPKNGDLVFLTCVRIKDKDLFCFLFASIETEDKYVVSDAHNNIRAIVEPDTLNRNQGYVFFVQDAAEAPTFFLNDVEYQIIDRKIVKN